MNKKENISKFFNELRLNAGAIWLENDKIQFSAPKEFQNKETNDFILSHKSQIIDVLIDNEISSEKDFLNREILKHKMQQAYPLSSSQERLWFVEQYNEGTNAYHMPLVYELYVDRASVKYALQQIVLRHEVLRSTIEQDNHHDFAVQKIHDSILIIEELYLKETDDYDSIIKKEINRPFNLSKEYPIRAKFYIIESIKDESLNKTLLLVNTHHIASDGWSMNIFQKELLMYQEAYLNQDKTFDMPPLDIQYKDYALWQRSYLNIETIEKQLKYWKDKLSGYRKLEFPTDYVRPIEIDYCGAIHEFNINLELSHKFAGLFSSKK
jgi:hypothetical protein